jgi:hypothetical protein
MVFSLALVGGSECALDYGMNWLRTVLNGGGCITRPCKGANLDFLSCEPALDMTYAASTATVELVTIDGGTPAGAGPEPVDGGTAAVPGSTIVDGGDPSTNPVSGIVVAPTVDLTTCLPEYQRSFHGVTFTAGPAVTAKMVTSSGQSVWTVEVTAVAADPAAYGAEHPLIAGFCAQNVDDPYVGGVPSGGIWDDDGYVTTDPACPTVVYAPVFDPTCPLLIPPPQVPDIPIGCNDFPDNFRRRMFTVPDKSVPTFGSVVPILTIHCPGSDVNNLRVRFYPDADNDQDPDDLCVYQGSALFTYLPANSTITFDAVDKAVYVDTPGMPTRRGDSIVIGDDGGPLEWPELVCGHGWVVTVDLPQTASLPSFDMSLYAKVT